jgi:HD-like signal output (HDOD) protein
MTEARDLMKGTLEIPSLPMIFTRIDEAVNNPRSSLADIGRVISEDSSLTARLLKIVNSAFYSFPSKIETISRAVTVVGTQQLRDLALATSVMKLFQGIPPDLINMEAFWKHSIACGVAARVLAAHKREANIERFFVAGILHDIGRLVLCMKDPDWMRSALGRCHASGELLYKVEIEELGFDHASLGRVLLENWKLPASLVETVAYHHNPEAAARFPIEAAVVHLADIIAHAMQLGSSGERFVPPLSPLAWERAGMSAGQLPAAIEQIDQQYREAVEWMAPEGSA